MKFLITNISFDTDGDKKLAEKLKKEWVGKTFEADDINEAFSEGADIISDQCGWCIYNMEYSEVL